ncbi:MAG: hypothetical protein H6Q90_4905 [Deltaproteobacteria bacterium]|nr:hypothetical protein [Deltaproteobacteria bacterium]
MCISPEVSFAMSGVLGVSGAYCVQRAVRVDRSFLPLAIIPVMFGIQQFSEGLVWVGLERGDPAMVSAAARVFLYVALAFWPIWVPVSTLLVERHGRTKHFLVAMSGVGLVLGLGLMIPLFVDPSWLTVHVVHHSLHYNISRSPVFAVFPGGLWEVLYLLVVSAPLFVSSVNQLVHLGVAIILSAAVSYVLVEHTFASVWCFVAAGLSLYLCTVFFALDRASRGTAGAPHRT